MASNLTEQPTDQSGWRRMKVVIATKLDSGSRPTIRIGGWIANRQKADALLLHVVEASDMPFVPKEATLESLENARTRAGKELSELEEHFHEAHLDVRIVSTGGVADDADDYGSVPDAVCEIAEQEGASIVAVGTHASSQLERLVAGSTAARVVRHASCDVLVVPSALNPHRSYLPIRRILCGVDFSAAASRALRRAATLATAFSASLDVVHAWQVQPQLAEDLRVSRASVLEDREEKLEEFVGTHIPNINVERHLREGDPATQLGVLAEKTDAQLLVIGTRGRTGVTRFLLGSVAERTLNTSRGPLLIVR